MHNSQFLPTFCATYIAEKIRNRSCLRHGVAKQNAHTHQTMKSSDEYSQAVPVMYHRGASSRSAGGRANGRAVPCLATIHWTANSRFAWKYWQQSHCGTRSRVSVRRTRGKLESWTDANSFVSCTNLNHETQFAVFGKMAFCTRFS